MATGLSNNFLFYGWKIDYHFALDYVYAPSRIDDEEEEDPEEWQESEIVPGVFLKYVCPTPGLMLQECDFFIVIGDLCRRPTDIFPIDPDDLFDLLRDRELAEEGWRICRNLLGLPHDVRKTPPSMYAVTHYY
jgi:hypothetical protein